MCHVNLYGENHKLVGEIELPYDFGVEDVKVSYQWEYARNNNRLIPNPIYDSFLVNKYFVFRDMPIATSQGKIAILAQPIQGQEEKLVFGMIECISQNAKDFIYTKLKTKCKEYIQFYKYQNRVMAIHYNHTRKNFYAVWIPITMV